MTLANVKDDIVAQASFCDHPGAGLVDQSQWEAFLQQNFGLQQCTVCIIMSEVKNDIVKNEALYSCKGPEILHLLI